MKFSYQQEKALDGIRYWVDDPYGSQVKYLAGFAGTGKTTITSQLDAKFAAYTGQAARMLRSKGCSLATTIHQLIYKPYEYYDQKTKRYVTCYDISDEAPAATADLIVIDECSMVNEEMGKDLLSFGTKVLVVGDPAQLPPVVGGGFFTDRTPDWMLTEPHRQAKESGILRLATEIREGKGYNRNPGHYGSDVRIDSYGAFSSEMKSVNFLASFDQVIVGKNNTRHGLNDHFRQALYGQDVCRTPMALDKLVCLRNEPKLGLVNGGMWCTLGKAMDAGDDVVTFNLEDDDDPNNVLLGVLARTHYFAHRERELEGISYTIRKQYQDFDFGYVITAHKSQGSGYDRALVWDESGCFHKDAQRWLYTAVTRAAKELVMIAR